ncbi:unnamed protein product, partial [Schistosoma curassoni]|uniref:WH1 domain-containing protein n=1 Tax=Schistosoma curassoni TaxID=6186 RepID=A0A183KZN9_9TREM
SSIKTVYIFDESQNRYLIQNQYKNTDEKDLWKALSEEWDTQINHLDIGFIMDSWTKQKNYPLVIVKRNGSNVFFFEQIHYFQHYGNKSSQTNHDKEKIQEQRDRWVEQLEEHLNKPSSTDPSDPIASPADHPIDVTQPMIEEIKVIIRKFKCGKAVGLENIPAETSKSDTEVTANMLHFLFRKSREKEQVPLTNWKKRIAHQDTKDRRSEQI